jgi:SAM-dependent methyltransferase
MEYNKQPYSGDDTSGARTKDWYEKFVWPLIAIKNRIKLNLVLDVGCGNGRFTPKLSVISNKVVAFDPVEDIHPSYADNAEYFKCHLSDFEYVDKFDALFFIGSFMIIRTQGQTDIRTKCKDLLTNDGSVFILIDVKDEEMIYETFYIDDINKMKVDDRTSLVEVKLK